jgi:peptidoglycan LD-endopeptidase CwlK
VDANRTSLALAAACLGAFLCASSARAADGRDCLIAAYPGRIGGVADNAVAWCDGTIMPWDDGVAGKTLDQAIERPDLEDQLAQPYPAEGTNGAPAGYEPGRVRYEPFFRRMYGGSPEEVRRTLATVRWLGGRRVRMTTVNGVNERLAEVVEELTGMSVAVRRALSQVSGGFAWRRIRGTQRTSAHGFGIAVDAGGALADYWMWARPGRAGLRPYRNRIPLEAVAAFERHGFIWGGRWHRYDTMHFEYRPELLCGRLPPRQERAPRV